MLYDSGRTVYGQRGNLRNGKGHLSLGCDPCKHPPSLSSLGDENGQVSQRSKQLEEKSWDPFSLESFISPQTSTETHNFFSLKFIAYGVS